MKGLLLDGVKTLTFSRVVREKRASTHSPVPRARRRTGSGPELATSFRCQHRRGRVGGRGLVFRGLPQRLSAGKKAVTKVSCEKWAEDRLLYDEGLDLAWNFMADSCALGNGKIGRNGRRIRAGEVCLDASASVGWTDAFKKNPPGERKVRVGKFSVWSVCILLSLHLSWWNTNQRNGTSPQGSLAMSLMNPSPRRGPQLLRRWVGR